MKISVIMPCFNGERYLEDCLDSVLAQTTPDFELIVVDDGSTDRSLGIMERYAAQDARIRVLHQVNGGVSAARNLGLKHAQGEWLTFVDCDDLLPVDAFESLLAGARDGVDMVVGAHETFDADGNTQIEIPHSRWMDLRGENKKRRVCLRLIEGDSILNIMCNKLHRRALIERESIRLNPSVRIAEDALFNLEAALCGGDTVYVNKVTYRYRMHGASAMHSQRQGELKRHAPWLHAMRETLTRRGFMEQYYAAYLDSVVLRLYKDGGVSGVLREFSSSAGPFLPERMDVLSLTFGGRMLYAAVRAGMYPALYPFVYIWQTAGRKAGEAAFALRAQKERPK